MKALIIRTESRDAVDKAVDSLRRSLRPGDIILSGPIPKNVSTKYLNVVLMLTSRILKGITHSCMYVGDGKILDIDYKIIRSGTHIEELTLKQFVEGKIGMFGGVRIYAVKPRHYSRLQRRLAVTESRENFIAKSKELTHTLKGTAILGFRYVFRKNTHYKEDLSFRTDWTCSYMVAHILKKANVNIGKRASYTFVPSMFAYSRYFKVEKKIVLK